MVVDADQVAGCVVAWALRQTARAGGRSSSDVNPVRDAGLEALFEVVANELEPDPALSDVYEEAIRGRVGELTRQRLTLSVQEAASKDPDWAAILTGILDGLLAGGLVRRQCNGAAGEVSRDAETWSRELRAVHDLAADERRTLTALLPLPRGRSRVPQGWTIPTRLPAVWAALGHGGRAEALARAIPDVDMRALALREVVAALVQAGCHADAEKVARSILDPDLQADALTEVAAALANAGRSDRGADLLNRAAVVARFITDPYRRSWALVRMVGPCMQVGRPGRAAALATKAEAAARSILDPDLQADALADVAAALARADQDEHAERVAMSIHALETRVAALVRLAAMLVQVGRHERAAAVAAKAERMARSG